MPHRRRHWPAGGRVPNARRGVPTPRGDEASVRTEGNSAHGPFVQEWRCLSLASFNVPNLRRASRLRYADVTLRAARDSEISHHQAPPIRTQLSEASASGFYGRAYQLRRRDFPHPCRAVDLGRQHALAILTETGWAKWVCLSWHPIRGPSDSSLR